MKHLPKSTPTEILNDPYGFTYKEMSEVIGEDKARALYTELYKQPFHKENLMLSRLVDTFFSRTSWTMLLYAGNHSISVA